MKYLLLFLLSSTLFAGDIGPQHLVCRDKKKIVYSVYGDIKKSKNGWVVYNGGDQVVVVSTPSKKSKFKCGIEK